MDFDSASFVCWHCFLNSQLDLLKNILFFDQSGLHLQDGLNSVMCFPGQLLSQFSTKTTVLSLGNRLWATMVWPLEEHGHHDRFQTYKLSTNPSIGRSFVFPFNPDDWVATDAEASLEEGVGVLLSPQRPFEPLPQAALRQSVNLTYNDLVIIADALGVPNPVKLSRADLITRFCERLGDATFTEFAKSQEAGEKKNKEEECSDKCRASCIIAGGAG